MDWGIPTREAFNLEVEGQQVTVINTASRGRSERPPYTSPAVPKLNARVLPSVASNKAYNFAWTPPEGNNWKDFRLLTFTHSFFTHVLLLVNELPSPFFFTLLNVVDWHSGAVARTATGRLSVCFLGVFPCRVLHCLLCQHEFSLVHST